jgi:hypothetical protein
MNKNNIEKKRYQNLRKREMKNSSFSKGLITKIFTLETLLAA